MAKKYDKHQLLADYKTGEYTQRELAHKYKVSPATVNNITKGIEQNLNAVVNAQVEAAQTLSGISEQELNSVQEVSNKRIKALKLDDYLDSAAGLAAKKSVEILNKKDISMMEIEQFSKAQNNIRVGLGTQAKFANASNVNIDNTNAQQNTAPELVINVN